MCPRPAPPPDPGPRPPPVRASPRLSPVSLARLPSVARLPLQSFLMPLLRRRPLCPTSFGRPHRPRERRRPGRGLPGRGRRHWNVPPHLLELPGQLSLVDESRPLPRSLYRTRLSPPLRRLLNEPAQPGERGGVGFLVVDHHGVRLPPRRVSPRRAGMLRRSDSFILAWVCCALLRGSFVSDRAWPAAVEPARAKGWRGNARPQGLGHALRFAASGPARLVDAEHLSALKMERPYVPSWTASIV